ncbi:hypothetical protein [Streptomyces cyslabdanicus]|uniref:hypothetical protein n=1 Tax=Streptomyces cyslabdanicus TaxID=1470456 RepID=UPI004044801F
MTWSAALSGAALRVTRTAAGRRALQLGLLVGALFALGFLSGQQARAAEAGPTAPAAGTVTAAVPEPASSPSPTSTSTSSPSVGDFATHSPTDRAAEFGVRPMADPAALPGVRLLTEPVVERVVRPLGTSVIEPAAAPVVRLGVPPVAESDAEPVVRPVVQSVVDRAVKPVVEPVAERAVKPVVEPVAERVVKPVVEPLAERVVKPVVEPVAERVVKPVVGAVVQTVVKPVVQPVVSVVAESVVRPVGDVVGAAVGGVGEGMPEGATVPAGPGLPALLPLPSPSQPEPGSAASASQDQLQQRPGSAGPPTSGGHTTVSDSRTARGGTGTVSSAAYGPRYTGATGAIGETVGITVHVRAHHAPRADLVAPLTRLPAQRGPTGGPDDVLGDHAAADSGISRHGDAQAVTLPERAPLRLVPGAAARAAAAVTRDRYQAVPVFPG